METQHYCILFCLCPICSFEIFRMLNNFLRIGFHRNRVCINISTSINSVLGNKCKTLWRFINFIRYYFHTMCLYLCSHQSHSMLPKNNNQINVTEFGLVCVQFIHISPLIFPANSTYFIEYCIFWNHLDREKKENIFRFCIYVLHDCIFFTKVTKHLHMCVYFI